MMKNSGLHQQQQAKALQALSNTNHQSQSMGSSKMGHSLTNLSTGGAGDLSRSSNAPVASGSPSNSVSKSTGGSPPASGSVKGGQPVVQLSSPQQQSSKNSASTSGSKSASTNHYSSLPMPSILGQQPSMAHSGGKQQSHGPSLKQQQPFPPGGHFFISNAFPQGPPQHVNAGAGAGLYQKRPSDKAQQQQHQQQQNAVSGSSAMLSLSSGSMSISTAAIPADAAKAHAAAGGRLHPAAGGFMHLATAGQSPSGSPHSHLSAAQLSFGAMSMPVKPTSDQKPAAGK